MKKMKKALAIVLMLSVVMMLGACGGGNTQNDKNETTNQDPAPAGPSVNVMFDMLGITGTEVVTTFGEGQEDADEDGNVWSHTYNMDFAEGKAEVRFIYDDQMVVQSINMMFGEGNAQLAQENLSARFGEGETVADETIEGNEFLRWMSENCEVILNEGNGPVQVIMSILYDMDIENPGDEIGGGYEELPPVEINPELSAMMGKILTDVGELPVLGEMPLDSENFQYFAFCEYQEGLEGLASEAMMGSIAHSVVLVKVPEGISASAIAEEIETNVDPRKWICVEAEKTIVSVKGDIVLLVMTQEATANAINDNFLAL